MLRRTHKLKSRHISLWVCDRSLFGANERASKKCVFFSFFFFFNFGVAGTTMSGQYNATNENGIITIIVIIWFERERELQETNISCNNNYMGVCYRHVWLFFFSGMWLRWTWASASQSSHPFVAWLLAWCYGRVSPTFGQIGPRMCVCVDVRDVCQRDVCS